MSEERGEVGTDITGLVGSAELFDRASDYDGFQLWARDHYDIESLETLFNGYRLFTRTALHVLGYSFIMRGAAIEIERDYHFTKSLRELGDIDKVQSDCEAAALGRKINQYNRQIALATTRDDLKSELDEATAQFSEPIQSIISGKIGIEHSSLKLHKGVIWASAVQNFTFLVDNRKNHPWGLHVSDFDFFISNREALDSCLFGYALALEYFWRNFAREFDLEEGGFEGLHDVESFKEIDERWYGELQNLFFTPIDERFGIELGDSPLFLSEPIPENTFSHLFSDDRIPVIGKEERLKQLLLWEHAERLDQHSLDSGALFVSIVEGIANFRQRLNMEDPVWVRRFVHPDPDVGGNNYSYAVRIDSPHLLGTGGMRGWATFVRLGTDYSGYGSSQYERTEAFLDKLSDQGLIEVEEMRLPEKRFEELLENNHGGSTLGMAGDAPIARDPRYFGMTVEEMLEGESKRVEYKREFPGTNELAQEIAALANTEGGVILLGIDDDGSIVGVEDVEGLQLRVANLATSERFRPPIYPEFHVVNKSGADILIVEISELDSPCAVDYRYYARVGTSVRQQLYEELKQRFD